MNVIRIENEDITEEQWMEFTCEECKGHLNPTCTYTFVEQTFEDNKVITAVDNHTDRIVFICNDG